MKEIASFICKHEKKHLKALNMVTTMHVKLTKKFNDQIFIRESSNLKTKNSKAVP